MRLNLKKEKGAIFSDCKKYRYALWRVWDTELPLVMFLMLNPSTADESADDPTLRRCIGYAKEWGYGGVIKANLFAYRSTDFSKLYDVEDPIGPLTDKYLKKLKSKSSTVIGAWGNWGAYKERSVHIRSIFPELYCLKINASGEPAHPLYLRKTLKPIEFKG